MKNIILDIQNWYINQCDGDWEHEYGIKIETTDNPGWLITIDIPDLKGLVQEVNIQSDDSKSDWINIQIKDGHYIASGDPMKLLFLLKKFKELVIDGE